MKSARRVWCVFSPSGPSGPTQVHTCRENAETECRRLARLYPGQVFYAMESVSGFAKIEVQQLEIVDDDDGIPW